MTGDIMLKMMLATLAVTMIFLTIEELFRHTRTRRDQHRWQWRATMAEKRTSDIMWLRDRFWMIVRLIGATGMLAFVAHFLWTNR